MMDELLGDEHLLVQELLKEHDLSVTQLAQRAGLADSTMYEYTGGRRKNIPLIIWRALYELTEDVRIANLIIGEGKGFLVPIPHPDKIDTSEATLKQLIEKRKTDIECEIAILDILADGRVDKADRVSIDRYRHAYPEAIRLESQIYYTIMACFERNTKGKT
jgi:transcriptional regulator with XRE-family HTH domain